MQSMIRRLPLLFGPGSMPHYVNVSLPLVPFLLDGVKYMREDQIPPPESRNLREMKSDKPRPPRTPSMRVMVRYALRSQSAEEFGKRMRKRYAANADKPSPRAEPEVDRELDRLFDPVK
jgi:hypothetical protein